MDTIFIFSKNVMDTIIAVVFDVFSPPHVTHVHGMHAIESYVGRWSVTWPVNVGLFVCLLLMDMPLEIGITPKALVNQTIRSISGCMYDVGNLYFLWLPTKNY